MKQLFSGPTALILTALILFALPLRAEDIPAEDLEVFFELVAVGPAAAVQAALAETPALATARDVSGFEAMHMLDYQDFDQKLKLLKDSGADLNTRNDDGIGLIHILIDPDFLPQLLAAGADINLRDAKGRTPLMLFAQEPNGQDMLRALLTAGADATLRDADGHSAVYYAQESRQEEGLIQTLINAGAPTD